MRRIAACLCIFNVGLLGIKLTLASEPEQKFTEKRTLLLSEPIRDMYVDIVSKYRSGEKKGYEKRIRALVALEPNNPLVFVCAADLAALHGDFELGNELSRAAVVADPKEPKAWNIRADIQFEREEYVEAIKSISKAIELGSGENQAKRYFLRSVAISRLGDLKRFAFAKIAIEDMEKARKLDDRAEWNLAHCTVLYNILRLDDALVMVDDYIKRMPNDPGAAVMRAQVLIVLDRTKEADLEFTRLKKLDPKRAEREPKIRQSAETAKADYAKFNKYAKDPSLLLEPFPLPENSRK